MRGATIRGEPNGLAGNGVRRISLFLRSGYNPGNCGVEGAGSPGSTVPTLGASGAIAAVMGAFIVTYPRDRIRSILIIFVFVRITMIPAALLIGVWFLIQLVNAGSVATVQTGGVAYLAHVGGFIFGAATARLWRRTPAEY
jgi:membrane associated rhomboid family serine protease